MNNKREEYQRIERFLHGQLDDAERAAFLSALDRDPELRAEVELHRELEASFGDPEYERLRQVLSEAESNASASKSWLRDRHLRRRWLAIAASLLVVLAAGIWLLRPSPPSPETLFAQYFTPYPADAFRTAEAGPPPPEAIETYRAGRYAEAVIQFENLPPAALTPELRFYYGLALLGDNQGRQAAAAFEELIDDGSLNGLEQPLKWYLALACLQAGDQEKAGTLLKAIAADPDHYQQKNALEILENR